jgi:small subunit ribosomal protein S1
MNDTGALVDVGQKSEGKLNISEITINGEVQYKVGDTIKVMITSSRGERPGISYKKVLQKAQFDAFLKEHGEEPENLVVEEQLFLLNQEQDL